MIAVILAVFGLCLGSFVNAIVWRMHEQEKLKAKSSKLKARKGDSRLLTKDFRLSAQDLSILKGRSMCDHCGHQLSSLDLVPLLSWLALRGRCRYCKKAVSWQHPAVELAMAAVFVGSYYFWPLAVAGAGQWVLFITWLVTSVGLMALLLYDLQFMLLPSRIIYPTLAVAATGRLTYLLWYDPARGQGFVQWAFSLGVSSGVFLLLFYVSRGRWIGFGDVRLGLITGTILATPAKSFVMIFLASLMGTLFVLPAIATGKTKMTSRIPYGPFLITASFIVILFGQSFINWYQNHLL